MHALFSTHKIHKELRIASLTDHACVVCRKLGKPKLIGTCFFSSPLSSSFFSLFFSLLLLQWLLLLFRYSAKSTPLYHRHAQKGDAVTLNTGNSGISRFLVLSGSCHRGDQEHLLLRVRPTFLYSGWPHSISVGGNCCRCTLWQINRQDWWLIRPVNQQTVNNQQNTIANLFGGKKKRTGGGRGGGKQLTLWSSKGYKETVKCYSIFFSTKTKGVSRTIAIYQQRDLY